MGTQKSDDQLLFEDIYEGLKDQNQAGLCAVAPDFWKACETPVQQAQVRGLFINRASQLGMQQLKAITALFDRLGEEEKERELRKKAREAKLNAEFYPAYLELDKNGMPKATVQNYLLIMQYDKMYSGVRFNLLKNEAERTVERDGTITVEPWTDADEAESIKFIEETFHFYNDKKHTKALALLFKEREFNPVMGVVEALEWDGTERISSFLSTWMKAEDTPYTREVSRLIFAGGINRLYEPGCKFDDVPVLIGTQQGEGKSTICRWLAIEDIYYTDITQFEGTQAIEQLEGGWICEIGELLALNRARDQEGVKSFITRQHDKYRKPYAPNVSVLPRRCIFIATTNNVSFLKDKSGNRRFYPVEVHSVGHELYEHEQEARYFICQCWAEARDKYKAGNMPPVADHRLSEVFKMAQSEAMEDDWREGALETFLRRMHKGDRVCSRMITREGFTIGGDLPHDPSKKESMEITQMMTKMTAWKREKNKHRCGTYGEQRCWIKLWDDSPNLPEDEENPLRR